MLRLVIAATAGMLAMSSPTWALTASDCAKLSDPQKKDDCVRSLPTAGKSGTTPATAADPSGSGRATPATPAVPGGGGGAGKGKGR